MNDAGANNKNGLLEKGRSGVLHVIFGRSAVVLVLILIQLILMFWVFDYFRKSVPYFFGGHLIIALALVFIVLNRPSNPAMQLSWVVIIMISPIVGGLFYFYVETHPGQRILEKRLETLYKQTAKYITQDEEIARKLAEQDKGTARMADYIRKHGNFSVYQNTKVTYFPLGENKFEAMLRELEKAEKFIFLEYFIVEKGYMWAKILEVLQRKVAEGVEVRLMYDGTCAFNYLPYRYPDEIKKMGIQCKMFSPILPILSTHYNNRDHRKILVIDGKVGFTGGVNIGDEYINRRSPFGHWKDTAILLKGEAVWSMTVMFLTMWEYTRDVEEDYRRFRPDKLPPEAAQGAGYYVQPYADNPLDEEAVGEAVYLNLINKAERYVYAMTPYLIISDSVNTALCNAAKSGVDVRIITPHIPDKALVFELTRSHYESLLEAGVQIFEYTPGFVHAKVMVTDDCCGVVGSINLDYRSMFLHFEDAVLLYHDPTVLDIKRDFINTQFRSQPVTLEQCLGHSWIRRLFRSILRVLAPLL